MFWLVCDWLYIDAPVCPSKSSCGPAIYTCWPVDAPRSRDARLLWKSAVIARDQVYPLCAGGETGLRAAGESRTGDRACPSFFVRLDHQAANKVSTNSLRVVLFGLLSILRVNTYELLGAGHRCHCYNRLLRTARKPIAIFRIQVQTLCMAQRPHNQAAYNTGYMQV